MDSRLFMYYNSVSIITEINNIYKITNQSSLDTLNNTVILLISSIIVLEVLTLFVLLMMIPFYYMI